MYTYIHCVVNTKKCYYGVNYNIQNIFLAAETFASGRNADLKTFVLGKRRLVFLIHTLLKNILWRYKLL